MMGRSGVYPSALCKALLSPHFLSFVIPLGCRANGRYSNTMSGNRGMAKRRGTPCLLHCEKNMIGSRGMTKESGTPRLAIITNYL